MIDPVLGSTLLAIANALLNEALVSSMEKVSLDFKSTSTGKTTSNVHIRIACSCGPGDSYFTAGGGVFWNGNREGGNQRSDESEEAENNGSTSNSTMLRVVVLKNCRGSYLSFANMFCGRKVKRRRE